MSTRPATSSCRTVGCSQGAGPHAAHDDLLLSGGWDGPQPFLSEVRATLVTLHADLCRGRAAAVNLDVPRAIELQGYASRVVALVDRIDASTRPPAASVAIALAQKGIDEMNERQEADRA